MFDLPCVHHWYVQPSQPQWLYEDVWIERYPKPQRAPYVAAIKRKKVIVAISFPDNPDKPWEGFTRLGYDALWTIIPDVITENLIRFRFERKICDLYRNGERVPGYPPSVYPAYERSRWPQSPV